MKLAETNLVKKVIGISKYCHNSDLMPALGLDNIETVIKDLTLGFNKRLCDNPFTKELLDHRYHEINGINRLVHINDIIRDNWLYIRTEVEDEFNIEDIYKACHKIILKDKRDFKNMTRYGNNIFELKKILKIMNIKKERDYYMRV